MCLLAILHTILRRIALKRCGPGCSMSAGFRYLRTKLTQGQSRLSESSHKVVGTLTLQEVYAHLGR
jgi:hypothetical protein